TITLALEPPGVEHWYHKQRNDLQEHPAHAGNGHRYHNIGPAAGRGKHRDKRQDGGSRCHHRGTNTSPGGFAYGAVHFFQCARIVAVKYLVEIGRHHHATLGGNAEQGDKAHPHGNTQVHRAHLEQLPHVGAEQDEVHKPGLPVEPHKHKTARPGHKYTAENHGRNRHGLKLEVDNQKDQQHGNGQDNRQALGGANLIFIIACKLIADTRRNGQLTGINLLLEVILRVFHGIHFGHAVHAVKNHVSNQEGVFAFDSLRSLPVPNFGQLPKRYLLTRGRRHQHTFNLLRIIALLTGIAHAHRIALAALNGIGYGNPTQRYFNKMLDILHGNAIACNFLAVHINFQIRFSHNPIRENRSRLNARNLFELFFQPKTEIFNGLQVRTFNLHTHGRSHTRLQHNLLGLDRL